MNYLPYFVARSSATSLDRKGAPGRVLTTLIMLPIAAAVIGLAGVVLVAVGAVLWSLI